MGDSGWTRLACLFLILSVLTALARMGGGAEARSLGARVPDDMFFPQARETPAPMRWTEDSLSDLEDMRSDPRPPDGLASGPPNGLAREAEGSARTNDGRAGKEPPPREGNGRAAPAAEPPLFYRPAGPSPEPASGPVCGDLRDAPEGSRVVFPLEREFFYSYEDTWGAPRAQGGHEGTDLMTPSGAPEYAITDGTVVPVAGSKPGGWNTLGGHAVMVRADYSIGPVREGDLFYYAHLERKSPLRVGDRVRAGQVVGYAGDTGQGPRGTSGLFPPHLHLGWYDGTGGRQQATSGAMNPFPLLEWIRSNGGAVSGGSEARFCEAPRTGPPTPSAHDGAWPTASNPDLDTGRNRRNAPAEKPGHDTKRPSHPDRDDKDRRGSHRKEDSKSHKPDPPNREPKRQARPDPGDDRNRPKPHPSGEDPQSPDPPEEPREPGNGGQYDAATGKGAAPPDQPPRPKQDHKQDHKREDEKSGAGKNAGEGRHRL